MNAKVNVEIFKNLFEEQIPFNKMLQLKLLEVQPGFVKILLPFRKEFIGDFRRNAIHGGVISGLLDNVGGAAAMTTMNNMKERLATIDLRIDFLEPGKPEDIIATGRIVRSGKMIIVTEMKAMQGNNLMVIAEARGVYYARREKS